MCTESSLASKNDPMVYSMRPHDEFSSCFRIEAIGKHSLRETAFIPQRQFFRMIFTGNSQIRVHSTANDRLYGKMSLIFIGKDESVSLLTDSASGDIYTLYLSGVCCAYLLNAFKNASPDGASLLCSPDILIRFEDLISNFDMYAADDLRELQFFVNLIGDAISASNASGSENIPEYIKSIKELFDNEYTQSYTLDMLEHRFHVNKYKIAKDFTRCYGTSPISYLNKSRIEHAKKLLLTTDYRINEIGFSVGIETTNHFIRLFKKYTSLTPAVYRKLSRTREI